MDEFEGVDFTGLLDFKGSEVVIFCPKADRIGVDLFPVIQLSVKNSQVKEEFERNKELFDRS